MLRQILSKINFRQIILYIIAYWFLTKAFVVLSYLTDIQLLEIYHESDYSEINHKISVLNISIDELNQYFIFTQTSGFVGLLIALVLSLIVAKMRQWHWLNPVIVSVLSYFPWQVHTNMQVMSTMKIMIPSSVNIVVAFAAVGMAMLGISVWILLSPKIKLLCDRD